MISKSNIFSLSFPVKNDDDTALFAEDIGSVGETSMNV